MERAGLEGSAVASADGVAVASKCFLCGAMARIAPEALKHALGEISHPYQPAADGKKTIRELRAG